LECRPVIPGKQYIDWGLPDPADQPLATVCDIRDAITTRLRRPHQTTGPTRQHNVGLAPSLIETPEQHAARQEDV
jgi:hypothetical protein